jgi:hypothetical protein
MDRSQLATEGLELRGGYPGLPEEIVELVVTPELPHFHCILDRRTRSVDMRLAIYDRNRANIQIQPWRESPVQAQLFLTQERSPLEGTLIEEGEANGTFDLIRQLAGEQNPRNVGLDQHDSGHAVWIRLLLQQGGQVLWQSGAHRS